MATKRYNIKTFDFVVNGEHIYFTCSTTNTKNGFCHHVFAIGGGKDYEHTRVSYINRTWESFQYETALLSAVAKFRKSLREPLRLEIQAVAKNEHEKAEAFLLNSVQTLRRLVLNKENLSRNTLQLLLAWNRQKL